MMKKLIQYWWIGVPALFIAGSALADYAATAGSGLTFASNLVSGANYMTNMLCDLTAGKTQCAAVSAAGAVKVDGSAVTQPVSGTVGISGTPAVTVSSGTVGISGTVNTGLATGTYGTAPGAVAATPVNSYITNLNANGQSTMSASAPVAIASDQKYIGTSNGWTTKLLNALTNTAVNIKASGGQLGKLYCWNPNSSVAYIQTYNSASPTVGTGVIQSYGIPPTNSSGFVMDLVGDQYSTAISVAATTTALGSTAPSTALDCNASYN